MLDVRISDVTTLTVLFDGEGHGLVVKLVVGVCQDDAPLAEGGVRRQRQHQVGDTGHNIKRCVWLMMFPNPNLPADPGSNFSEPWQVW